MLLFFCCSSEVQCRCDSCEGSADCCWKSFPSCQGQTLEQVRDKDVVSMMSVVCNCSVYSWGICLLNLRPVCSLHCLLLISFLSYVVFWLPRSVAVRYHNSDWSIDWLIDWSNDLDRTSCQSVHQTGYKCITLNFFYKTIVFKQYYACWTSLTVAEWLLKKYSLAQHQRSIGILKILIHTISIWCDATGL